MQDTVSTVAIDLDFYPAYPGELLNGRYEILRKLGGGAHSATWLVRDTKYAVNKHEETVAGYVVNTMYPQHPTDHDLT